MLIVIYIIRCKFWHCVKIPSIIPGWKWFQSTSHLIVVSPRFLPKRLDVRIKTASFDIKILRVQTPFPCNDFQCHIL